MYIGDTAIIIIIIIIISIISSQTICFRTDYCRLSFPLTGFCYFMFCFRE